MCQIEGSVSVSPSRLHLVFLDLLSGHVRRVLLATSMEAADGIDMIRAKLRQALYRRRIQLGCAKIVRPAEHAGSRLAPGYYIARLGRQ